MKILMMSNTYFPLVGGLERSIRSFSDEFRKRGHEVLIVAPSSFGKAEDEEFVIRVPAIKHVNKTDFSINLPIPGIVSKLMRTFSPQIVHSHHPFFMGDFALRLSRQYRIPFVFTHHIMFEQYMHYLPVQNERITRFVVELATGYANWAHQVIAPTVSVREILQKRGVHTPIDVVPTGIGPEHFAKGDRVSFRHRHNIPEEVFVIGHVGRLATEKNLDFLMGCLVEFLKKDPSAHALIVGQGPLEGMIKSAFEHASLGERLHLVGFLHNQDLVDAYHAMDVFAFASLSETQGVVLLEAMAAGLPVVAISASGVREVVRDRVNGRLLSEGNQGKFVEALLWIKHSDPVQWQELKKHCRETAGMYSMSSCAQRMIGIYERLLEGRSLHSEERDNSWQMLKARIKAEWDIVKNVVEAGEAAILHKGLSHEGGE